MGRRGSDDKKWQDVKKKVEKRDQGRDRMELALSLVEYKILRAEAKQYIKTIDPAHVIPVSRNYSMCYDEDNIISLFNPVMTLYGLVGAYENISISKDPSSEVASFDITFEADNNGVADKLVSQCNGSRIEVLESKININCNKESETLLHIQLIQEV